MAEKRGGATALSSVPTMHERALPEEYQVCEKRRVRRICIIIAGKRSSSGDSTRVDLRGIYENSVEQFCEQFINEKQHGEIYQNSAW